MSALTSRKQLRNRHARRIARKAFRDLGLKVSTNRRYTTDFTVALPW